MTAYYTNNLTAKQAFQQQANHQAAHLYAQASQVSFAQSIRHLFGIEKPGLQSLNADADASRVAAHKVEAKVVNLDAIKGSCGRSRDFDADYKPINTHSKERWLRVATAVFTGKQLPPVELVQIDAHYYVTDGNHRVSVAKALGQETIQAHVTVWEMDSWEVASSAISQ